eukprot:CAMPEP_0119014992 /NCGR_PEP_ID=MMETSP1176-20130426/10498_1 /TAXON_ID=265551 /ORGANISM="Synedropsis recta cf, Strain CCMP1620" /LENGTH=521 /DNA_ID=CAMNT_0006968249 /DNA_START=54 /DNA_END=1619 /DNA_ORIENTATION=-
MAPLSRKNQRALNILGLACLLVVVYLPDDWLSLNNIRMRQLRLVYLPNEGAYHLDTQATRTLRRHNADHVANYDQNNIMRAVKHFPVFTPDLLVFDGDKFEAFGIQRNGSSYMQPIKYSYRYATTIPLLVRTLKETFPDRFQPGQPVFEMLFTHADASNSPCVNHRDCDSSSFAPLAFFGATAKDESIFPTVKPFPFTEFVDCMFEYKVNGRETCVWRQKVNKGVPWDELIDLLVWRGSDYDFMDYDDNFKYQGPQHISPYFDNEWRNASKEEIINDLTSAPLLEKFNPRWKAVLETLQSENLQDPWIDAKFVGGYHHESVRTKLAQKGLNMNGERIGAFEMSNYKYQIDLGGGGGTTREGTIEKLLMPGLLFHHSTPNMDWFYDMMIPWKHYVPVKCDLSDLKHMMLLAKNQPDRMKLIAQEATKLGEYLLSKDYMDTAYQDLFVGYMGKLITSYQPTGSWQETAQRYKAIGFDIFSVATCSDDIQCIIHGTQNDSKVYQYRFDAPPDNNVEEDQTVETV